ncbi:hypothetical protein FRC00_009667, partial [Tulasnella sp. 408]
MSSARSPAEQTANGGSLPNSNRPLPDPSITLSIVGPSNQASELGFPNEPRSDQQPLTNPP